MGRLECRYNRSVMPFASIPEALDDFRRGRMLVVVDDEDRENEGDLTVAAEFVTPDIINFMAVHGRGLICLALSPERCDALGLPLMSPKNTSNFGTAFTESIDAREGVSTGISAADRSHTIRLCMQASTRAEDLARPGHVFPLRAREGGVLVRAGQTEAAVDLARLAGLSAGGVICEIMNDDGSMSRLPDLVSFCQKHQLKLITVADLIRYRMQHERFNPAPRRGLRQHQLRRVSHAQLFEFDEWRASSCPGLRRTTTSPPRRSSACTHTVFTAMFSALAVAVAARYSISR